MDVGGFRLKSHRQLAENNNSNKCFFKVEQEAQTG